MNSSVSYASSANQVEKSCHENFEPRLTYEEKSRILALSESEVDKKKIVAICAYGSRVAGCARDDSAYDILIVARNLEPEMISKREVSPINSSILIVDEEEIIKEAKEFLNREFVVARFLNIYEPIVNAEFLQTVEIEYKKRVIGEELSAISSEYGFFAPNLIIPLQYFLFNRLHNRALFFPTAVESFARTYSSARRKENIEFSLASFRIAAGMVESDKIIERKNDSVRLLKGKRGAAAISKLRQKFRARIDVAKGRDSHHEFDDLTDYEFETKPLWNWKKVRGNVQCIQELDQPKSILQLEEGVLLDDGRRNNLVDKIARSCGFSDEYHFEEKKLGTRVNSSTKLEIWDSRNRSKYVLKEFREISSAKWAFLNTWAVFAKKFSMTPIARLSREVEGVRWMHELGIPTHRVVGVALDKKILATEYVEGKPLIKFVQEILDGFSVDTTRIEEYGKVLGKLHKANLMYGDTKPQNALVGQNGIYLLDLEQCVENGDAAWDIAEFLYYCAAPLEKEKEKKDENAAGSSLKDEFTREERMALVTRDFLDSYEQENGREVIVKAFSPRYMTPFIPVIAPSMANAIRKTMSEYSSGTDSNV